MNRPFLKTIATCAIALSSVGWVAKAAANTVWQWSYSGSGIDASGSLTTSDTHDANGFYQILSIAGNRNGDAITGLYPTGTAIPGNEPYAIDNLIKIGSSGQITSEGFGYTLASGAHANPYFADWLLPPAYSEVFTQGTTFISELPVTFSAAPVPEPSAALLLIAGLGGFAVFGVRRRTAV